MGNTEPKIDIGEMLLELGRNGHASHAIWVAAVLEENLADLLALCMPNLSNRMREKLFTGYGPLSSFSAKIDIAYGLEKIPGHLRRDLHVIREIRNRFAHSTEKVHFETDEMLELLKKFSDYNPKMDRMVFYTNKLEKCLEILTPAKNLLALTNELMRPRLEKAGASPEKTE